MRLDQQRRELLARCQAAANGERAERDAVIALAAGDEMTPLRLAAFDEILPRHFQRGFDRLGAAADEERVAHSLRRMRGEVVGQTFECRRGEEAGVGELESVELRLHRRDDVGMRMAETGHGGAAGGVEILLAGVVVDVNAFAAHGDRVVVTNLTMEYVSHART
jgi:hypothetical protein